MHTDTASYNAALEPGDREVCDLLAQDIRRHLPEADNKIWHGHPVWFVDGNPIVGYHLMKGGLKVLFWSGQSFTTPGLSPLGSFKAANFFPGSVAALAESPFEDWLKQAIAIQWDYKNLPKNKGLVKLTEF